MRIFLSLGLEKESKMALTQCKECKNSISNTAKACPQCGAKVKRPTGCAKFIGIFIVIIFLYTIFHDIAKNSAEQEHEAVEKAHLASLTPEQRAVEEKKKAAEVAAQEQIAKLDNARIACQMFVKKTLHDPGSAEFDDYRTYYAERLKNNVYHVQVQARAKNGFNALRHITVDCTTQLSNGQWAALHIKQIN